LSKKINKVSLRRVYQVTSYKVKGLYDILPPGCDWLQVKS